MVPRWLMAAALLLAGCAPVAPTATHTPAPTPSPIPVPTATLPPLSAVELEPLLLQSGDLPADYLAGQIRRTWPDSAGEPAAAVQVRQVSLRAGDFVGDGLTLALYASPTAAEAAYHYLADRLPEAEAQADLGVVATVAEARNNVFGVTSVQVVWWECVGVGYLDLLANSYDLRETAVTYAQRAADRLKDIACRE